MQERSAGMVEELRKAEVVRERLLTLKQVAESYPDGHDMRVRLESLNLDRVLGMVEDDISTLRDALIHPGDT